ncbi:MAG: T9SS type A sorting domain-containing protein, partial [Candidatus Cloacimonetes bacterium]|nr:T9SS type A sorting domain-containing protein [Candidatus Cloacimonadota bacterium]
TCPPWRIIIYNIKGQKIKTLVDKKLDAGYHSVIWDGKNEEQCPVASGVYLYKLTNEKYSSIRKMLLMK